MLDLDSKDSYKRRKPTNYHVSTYSGIATFSFANGPTVFSPRRKMSFRDGDVSDLGNNLEEVHSNESSDAKEPPGFYQDMRDAFFHAGRAIMTVVGLYNAAPHHSELDETKSSENKSNSLDTDHGENDVIHNPFVPSKKRRSINESEIFINMTPLKQIQNMRVLDEKLSHSITPEKQGNIMFSTEKDPFRWGSQEPHSTPTPTSALQSPYGSAFIRKRTNNAPTRGGSGQSSTRTAVEEITFLRMVYNGQYKAPALIESQKNEQLLLREQELKQYKATSSSPWLGLTEKIKAIMQKSMKSDNYDDDLIIIKERKIPPKELENELYGDQPFRFNTSILTFKEEFESYKKLKEERQRIQLEVREKRQKLKVLVPQLTDENLRDVKDTLRRSDNGMVMNKHSIELKVHDFKTLAPKRWLNDIIIEFFMKHIELTTARSVAFNSYFYTSLSRNGYQGVRRWMKRKKVEVQDLDKIFVPINLNQSHWALGVIDIGKRKIGYVDSLSNGPTSMSFAILKDLQNYLSQESKGALGHDFELVHKECPQQPNGFDCGVYVCTNALYLSKELPLTFDYKDVQRMRPYIGHLVLSGD
ncbi:LANO_0B02366g1_1 [Lachancea nothofagi CBS 11611]|uniref:LANO_0B02366g1_1 n=1 Tax=Lachancea nothofagi CBS 11611 TaxID=1266666 RepID=A0A1G4IVY7_9SACH|nr:LANO_0B02366g1_1 [Lachancea nothofagi CBS 11611]